MHHHSHHHGEHKRGSESRHHSTKLEISELFEVSVPDGEGKPIACPEILPNGSFLVGITTIHWRESWKCLWFFVYTWLTLSVRWRTWIALFFVRLRPRDNEHPVIGSCARVDRIYVVFKCGWRFGGDFGSGQTCWVSEAYEWTWSTWLFVVNLPDQGLWIFFEISEKKWICMFYVFSKKSHISVNWQTKFGVNTWCSVLIFY